MAEELFRQETYKIYAKYISWKQLSILMNYLKSILALFAFLFLISSSSAATYLNIYIDEAGNAEFLGESEDSIILPEGVSINEGKIRGSTQDLTIKYGDIWKFSYFLSESEINVILPENSAIKNSTALEIYLKRGKFVLYSQDSISVEYSIERENSSFLIFWIILIILVLIFLYFAYFRNIIFKKQTYLHSSNAQSSRRNKIEIIKSVLNEREKLIIDKLKETGKIKMSYLRRMSNIPKASFSRHIQELEKKKLIERSGEGKNKFVRLRR